MRLILIAAAEVRKDSDSRSGLEKDEAAR